MSLKDMRALNIITARLQGYTGPLCAVCGARTPIRRKAWFGILYRDGRQGVGVIACREHQFRTWSQNWRKHDAETRGRSTK